MEKSKILFLVFGTAIALGWAVTSLVGAWRTRMRGAGREEENRLRDIARPLSPFGFRLATFFLPRIEERVSTLIQACGGLNDLTMPEFFGIQILGGLIAAVCFAFVFLVSAMPVAFFGAGLVLISLFGWYAPYSCLMSKAKKRRRELLHDLPFSLDLMATSMHAGYDFNAAASVYVEKGKRGPLRDELAMMLREIRLGKTRRDALAALAARTGVQEMRTITSAIIQGSEMGSGIADILEVQAEDMRRRRFGRAEKIASHAPAKMIFPLALFVVPATMIIIFVPIVLKFLRR